MESVLFSLQIQYLSLGKLGDGQYGPQLHFHRGSQLSFSGNLLLRDSCVSYGYTSRPIYHSGVWKSWVTTPAEAVMAAILVVNPIFQK